VVEDELEEALVELESEDRLERSLETASAAVFAVLVLPD
jgi:hypothetical protein